MSRERSRLAGYSLSAGIVWGCLAFLLGHRALGPAIWGGVVAAALLGLAIGRLIHPRFEASQGWRRGAWPLVSIYAGALGFGVAVALSDLVVHGLGGRIPSAVLLDPVVTVLWGVTMTGYLLFLWPLAWFTHWVIEWRLGE